MADAVAAFVDRVPDEFVIVDETELAGRVVGLDDENAASEAPGSNVAIERARALLAGGSRIPAPAEIELLTPVAPRPLLDPLQSAVLDGGTPVSVVATGEAASLVGDGPLAAALPLLAGRDDVAVAVHGGDAPFAVLVRPDRVGFALVADGAIDCVFESEGEEARTWARAVVEGFRSEAEAVV